MIIFGIDGCTWSVIKPLVEQGHLPNFKKVLSVGASGKLRSVNPPVTCPAWATMMTGKNPATLGTFYFLKPNNNYKLDVSPLDWPAWQPIWDIFSKHDKKVMVFNIPTTIAQNVNGCFVSGPIWGEDYDRLAYPTELNEKLRADGYLVRPASNPKITGDDVFIRELFELTNMKMQLFHSYLKKPNWDLFIMSFNFGDTLQHYYWKYKDKAHPEYIPNNKYENVINDYFKVLDGFLGKVLECIPENTTLIFTSDHGQMRTDKYLNLNAWLSRNGFLHVRDDYLAQAKLTTNFAKKGFLKGLTFTTKAYSKLVYKTRLINWHFFTNLQARFKIWLSLFENKLHVRHKLNDYVDWENTKAYSLTLSTIYLNLSGRESKGIVSEQEYDKIRNEIKKELLKLKDPSTNELVVEDVWFKDEVYPNNPPDDFPDIIVGLNEGYINYYSELQSPLEMFSTDVHFSGVHNINGIFIAYGPEILHSEDLTNIKLEDVVPTILHIFDYPIPSDMDGRVLTEIFKKGSDAQLRSVRISDEKIKKTTEKDKLRAIRFSKKI